MHPDSPDSLPFLPPPFFVPLLEMTWSSDLVLSFTRATLLRVAYVLLPLYLIFFPFISSEILNSLTIAV